jgi:hypothetical protein
MTATNVNTSAPPTPALSNMKVYRLATQYHSIISSTVTRESKTSLGK